MSHEILSIAIFEPLEGLEAASIATFRELLAALTAGGYSRDTLHKDANSHTYVLIRHWKSEEARRAALEDPVVLRCWAKLSHEIRTVKVYETLEEVLAPETRSSQESAS
jgi:hypothetical protein